MTVARKYLRAGQIAALTGMSLRTIRRWIRAEVLPSTKLGGARLVATADLEAAFSTSRETLQGPSDTSEEYDDN
jgi:excisionase family DNA binding protein